MTRSNAIRCADVYGAINREINLCGSQMAFAEKAGVSSAFVSRVLHGHTRPSQKLLSAAGLKRVVTEHYEYAEDA